MKCSQYGEDKMKDFLPSLLKSLLGGRKPHSKGRRIRSDARIGTVEKKLGAGNVLRNKGGRNTRSDKKLGNFRKDWGK